METDLTDTTNAKQLDDVQAALRRIEDELTSLRQGIPKEIEQKLRDMETDLTDTRKWPRDSTEAETMRQSLDAVVQELPPVAVERLLPQLYRLNWAIEALWNLRTHANAQPDQLHEVQAVFEELLERHPRGHYDEIKRELEARLKEIGPQVREFEVKQLLERAQRALDGKEDASAAFSSLQGYQEDQRVASILPKLRTKVLERNWLERIKNLEDALKKARSIGDDDSRQLCLLTIQESVSRLMVDLNLEDAASKEEVLKRAKELLDQCEKELRDFDAKKVRCYQAWALRQIRYFDSPEGWYYDFILPWFRSELRQFKDATEDKDWKAFQVFPSLKDVIQEKLGVDLSEMKGAMLTAEKRREIYKKAAGPFGWTNNIDAELAFRATRDGMVEFLLPIQPHLLDPPVAQLYQQAFSKGWEKLEGRKDEDQLYVAQQSAIVRKKTIEEVASSNPCNP